MSQKRLRLRLCALLACCIPMLGAAEVPLSSFAQLDDFNEVTISPDGQYVAALLPSPEQIGLAVMRLSDGKLTGRFMLDAGRSIYQYWWVGPKRIVATTSLQIGSLNRPVPTGELVGMNADGGDVVYLFGSNGAPEVGTHLHRVTRTRAWATVIDPLPKDPGHAVITVNAFPPDPFTKVRPAFDDSQLTFTYRLNVESGVLDHQEASPISGWTDFLTDTSGVVRFAEGFDAHSNLLTFYKETGAKDWTAVNVGNLGSATVRPLQFAADGSKVYLQSNEGGGNDCLIEQDLKSTQRRALSCDDVADVDLVLFAADREPIAVVYGNDRPRMVLLDTVNPLRAKLAMLQKAFPGELAVPVSQTPDGTKMIVAVSSDHDPGSYYVFDAGTLKANFLLARRQSIDPEQMAERRPIVFKARDGQTLHGYVTLPQGREPKNLPLVVLPHGGPFWVSDSWRWDAEPELLASRGYAVLQVNFRGSGGYGARFVEAGKQNWDSVMIGDITDGTRWTVAQGIADAKRICIFGSSFGGYAALESAVREPDLYRCAVGNAGVYDLNLLKSDYDGPSSEFRGTFFKDFIGTSPERLKAASPLTDIDKLKSAVMIVHGEDDDVVPVSQAKALRKALDARKYPYELLIKPGEGHGFYLPKNREEFYTRLLAFLDRNIGTAAAASGDATAAPEPVAAKP